MPAELRNFLTDPGGHSLIIRGNAGTGKTTLALQLIEELDEMDNSFYFSSRVSDSILLEQFPWLANRRHGGRETEAEIPELLEFQQDLADTLTEPLPITPPEEDSGRLWFNKLKLRGAFDFEVRANQSFPQNRVDLSELERVYAAIEQAGKGRSLVVIDSVDAFAESCGVNAATVITSIQKDLVEGRKVNIIIVAESNDRYIDYLGDGVVELAILDHHRRRLREMNILKLRGCAINQPKYLYTLNEAKVRTFSDRTISPTAPIRGWHPITDSLGRISTGFSDLDRLVQGGISPGSIVLIELGLSVPLHITGLLEQIIVANFVAHHRGVLWVPLKKENTESARNRMVSLVTKESFDRYVRVPEVTTEVQDPHMPSMMRIEGTNAQLDFSWKTVAYALMDAQTPTLSLMGFDTLESIYGSNIMDQMTEHLAAVKRQKNLFIGIASPSTKSTARLVDLATCHLKVDRIGGTIIIYGVEPFTECNALSVTEFEDRTKLELVPII